MRRNKMMSMRKFGMGQNHMAKQTTQRNSEYKNVLNDHKMHPTLTQGATGEDVEMLQGMLVEIVTIYPSLPIVTIDGVFGGATKNAVEEFQKLNSIFASGMVDDQTWKMLHQINRIHGITEIDNRELTNGTDFLNESNNIIAEGSKNEYVRDLQKYLNIVAIKYNTISKLVVDGVFGPKTKVAVLQFQKLFNLTQDGIVGDTTWSALYEAATGSTGSTMGD